MRLLLCIFAVAAATPPHPNLVYFLVDDLGYANVGFTNDEPITPAIDKLESEGARLNAFYTYKFCS
jgi:arylsulfatase A-like enzyme